MPVTGPITPYHYSASGPNTVSPTSISPDPNGKLTARTSGEIFTCVRTGRIWLAPTQQQMQWIQSLPYTRNDSGTTGVKVTNEAGNMQFGLAGSDDGQVNFATQTNFTTSAIYAPGMAHFPVFAEIQATAGTVRNRLGTGYLQAIFPDFASISADVTLTNADQVYPLNTLTYAPGGVDQWATYRVCGLAWHNNAFDLSVCVSKFRAGAVKQEPIIATTVSSPQNGGYVSWELVVDKALLQSDETGSDMLRTTVVSSHAGVVIKANPGYVFPDSRPITIAPAATYRIAEVLA